MQINLAGHHVELTDGIREAVDHKFSKIQSHYPQLDRLDIYLTVERNEESVEVNCQYMGAPVVAKSTDHDLYVAIGTAAKKLEAALAHRKGTIKNNSNGRPAPDSMI